MNKNKEPPRVPDLNPKPIKRSTILDGSIKTYYGPRQFTTSVSLGNTTLTIGYPKDWPIKGRVLRVPQQVWLSTLLRFGGAINFLGRDLEYYYRGFFFPVDAFDYVCSDYGPYIFDHPDVAESDRIQTIYSHVKSTIESLRPNRTWVDIIDFNGQFDQSLFPYLFAPDISEEYFGTNFLHIFAGTASTIFYNDYPNIFSTDDYILGVARVKQAMKNFSNWGARIYSLDLEDQKFILPNYEFTYKGGGGAFWKNRADNITANRNAVNAINLEGLSPTFSSIGTYNVNDTTNYFNASTLYLTGSVDPQFWGKGTIPIVYKGISSIMTEQLLINQIADYFNFDPHNGKDL
jgi:hypothetical protein